MSEKRFELLLPNAIINDTVVRKSYYLSEKEDVEKLVALLNEQQATIQSLKEENKELEDEYDDFSNFLIDKGLEFEFEKWCKDE